MCSIFLLHTIAHRPRRYLPEARPMADTAIEDVTRLRSVCSTRNDARPAGLSRLPAVQMFVQPMQARRDSSLGATVFCGPPLSSLRDLAHYGDGFRGLTPPAKNFRPFGASPPAVRSCRLRRLPCPPRRPRPQRSLNTYLPVGRFSFQGCPRCGFSCSQRSVRGGTFKRQAAAGGMALVGARGPTTPGGFVPHRHPQAAPRLRRVAP